MFVTNNSLQLSTRINTIRKKMLRACHEFAQMVSYIVEFNVPLDTV